MIWYGCFEAKYGLCAAGDGPSGRLLGWKAGVNATNSFQGRYFLSVGVQTYAEAS
jgi:hypothetical protein